MRAWLPTLLAAVTSAGAVGCSKVDNPDFCCVHDCEAHGASGPVSCGSPRVCDADNFTCVDPTNGGPCNTPGDCPSVTPYCDETAHVCRQCLGAMGCTAMAPVCSDNGACTATCTDDNACTAFAGMQLGHCETTGAATGQCVECRTGGTDCAGNTPVCDANRCRPCETGSECASGVCELDGGACVTETDVIYMAPGAGGTSCTKGQPCGTFANALLRVGGTRRTISMAPGSYQERVAIANQTVTIIGEGADLSETSVGQIVDISGAATVKIEALRIHDGLGTSGTAVRCYDNGGAPSVSMFRVTLDANTGKGIDAFSNCAVQLERSRVLHNIGGGVSVNSGTFRLENNFIAVNGGLSSSLGGVSLQSPSATGPHLFQFNTVTGNGCVSTATSGVDCLSVGNPLTFSNNIVYGNTGGTGKQVNGANCNWTYSDLGDNTAGDGNITMDPQFVDTSQDNLHLMSTSPARDAADPAATIPVDIDGDPRPSPTGGRSDMGADEIAP